MGKNEVDLIDYFKVIWKRKMMIISIVIIATITSAIVSLLLPKIYEAAGIVKVGKYIVSFPYLKEKFTIEEPIENINQTCKILDRVLKDKVRRELKISKKKLKDKDIIITGIEGTNLIEINARAKTPKLAKEIVDTAVNLLLKYHQDIIKKKEDILKNKGVLIVIEFSEVATPAIEPEFPIRPKIALNILLAGILSLIAGIMVAFIKEAFKKGEAI